MEKLKPKVSIIITTYRRPLFLKGAIRSVLEQDFKNFELIIVDDDPYNSEIEKIISSFNDLRIFYFKNKKNLGGSKSLNIGINNSKGEYIAILDDDDLWITENKLSKQIDFLDNNKDFVIVGTSSVHTYDKKEVSRYTNGSTLENPKDFNLTRVPFAHSSVMYRKETILSVGGYTEDLPRGKDIDLYLKIIKLGKFGFLKDCFIEHRETRDNIKKKLIDSYFHRKVIWKHRRNFNYKISYLILSFRMVVFTFLLFFPFIYTIYKDPRKFIITLNFKSVSRYSLDIILVPQIKRIRKGFLLEIGGSSDENYKDFVPYSKILTLDLEKSNNPDIISDICDIDWESNYFDSVIAIEVLEHVLSPEKAIEEIFRILKPGGQVVLSTRFFNIYHPGPRDYYRFTWDSLGYLFRDFKKVEIYHHGNAIQAFWYVITSGKLKVIFNILNPIIAKISFRKTIIPLGFVVYAEK